MRQILPTIVVIGFMGAGKSTLGPDVAEQLGRPFIDLDRAIEHDLGKTIPELFLESGESEFRLQEEGQAIAALHLPEPAVIALGGGAVQTPSIRNELRDRAFTVLLEVDAQTAWERSGGRGRPLSNNRLAAGLAIDDQSSGECAEQDGGGAARRGSG